MSKKKKPSRPSVVSVVAHATAAEERPGHRRLGLVLGAVVLAIVLAFGAWLWAQHSVPSPAPMPLAATQPLRTIGSQSCIGCHAEQAAAWQGSHHQLAMQEATDRTVLGDFGDAKFAYAGTTATFFKRDARFYVNTDGADGRRADFEIKYTFGVTPLQQYLIEFPDGRLQALSIAWDTRPRAQGGQRWFHLYPRERITHKDPLHWTGLNQNWNWMCAECHTTNLKRNYDAATDSFKTTWSEINVACEACHGPGSAHLAWANEKGKQGVQPDKGLTVRFDERHNVSWRIDPVTGNATRSQPPAARKETETCGLCHSRRTPLGDGMAHAGRLMDSHDPALLSAGLYFPDGQQQDEVYTYASFLQSKMYARGVTCSDCHDPHSGKTRLSGNAVCHQCHATEKYAAGTHTLHREGSAGGSCAACHMPTRVYMGVDARHDHSLRIPRPDLSRKHGTPNACNGCHADKSSMWAAQAIEKAFGPPDRHAAGFVEALDAGRRNEFDARDKLIALAENGSMPDIARATAVAALRGMPGGRTLSAIEAALHSESPLMRGAALDSLLDYPPEERYPLVLPLIGNPVRAVRLKAARALAALPPQRLPLAGQQQLAGAFAEYVTSRQANASRPEARLELGLFYLDQGRSSDAEREYQAAIRLQADFSPAYLNLADLYRALGQEGRAEAVLKTGLARQAGDADLLYALALLRVRQGLRSEALPLLKEATAKRLDNPRMAYAYALALHEAGRRDEARAQLKRAHVRFPGDREILYAAAAFAQQAGDHKAAQDYLRLFATLAPDDPRVSALAKARTP